MSGILADGPAGSFSSAFHAVLVEVGDGKREQFRMANQAEDRDRLVVFLRGLPGLVRIALEPTDNFRRALAHLSVFCAQARALLPRRRANPLAQGFVIPSMLLIRNWFRGVKLPRNAL